MAENEVLINTADWDGPAWDTFPAGYVLVNAPWPVVGHMTWTGENRHGRHYAAGPDDDEGMAAAWKRDGALPAVFTETGPSRWPAVEEETGD